MLSERSKGFAAIITTCVIWGASPLYYHAISEVPPLTILAHRTVWSLVFFLVILALQRRLGRIVPAVVGPDWRRVLVAAVLISSNWFLFIWAISVGRVVESSLGYYIMPLFSVVLGVVFLRERLALVQWLAVGLACAAVLVLTLGLGVAPWVSLALASTFAVYGLVKKRVSLGPFMSVAAEVTVLTPLALAWLVHAGPGPGFGHDPVRTALLVGVGLITAVPLVTFAYGARRVGLATVGITMYLNPTLQFFCATVILAEPFTGWHLVAFAMIWLALALYASGLISATRAQGRAAAALVPNADAAIRGGYASRGPHD